MSNTLKLVILERLGSEGVDNLSSFLSSVKGPTDTLNLFQGIHFVSRGTDRVLCINIVHDRPQFNNFNLLDGQTSFKN